MASTQHRSKRHVQTSIASYFDKQPTSTPELDLDTQADLINVGMRVRKSVPEGYKTHKTVPSPQPAILRTQSSVQSVMQSWAPRELAPFSGLHKTGGLSQQQGWNGTPNEDDMPYLISSQETVSSTQSQDTAELRRKRSFEEDEGDVLFLTDMEYEDRVTGRIIAQPKTFDRRRRLMQILDNSQDFSEARFLQPDDFDMDEEYD